jgi:hypothetical protein
MNNNEFDQLIKESLDNFSSTPSSKLGKELGRKMFVKNIWLFHKSKVLILILFLGASTLFFLKTDSPVSQDLMVSNQDSENKKRSKELTNNKSAYISDLGKEDVNTLTKNENNKPVETKTNKGESANKSIIRKNNSTVTHKNTSINNSTITHKNTSVNNLSHHLHSTHKKKRSKQLNNKQLANKRIKQLSNETIIRDKELTSPKKNNTTGENYKFIKKQAKYIKNEMDNELVDFVNKAYYSDDYAKEKNGKISIDAFFTPYNQTKIVNRVNEKYANNWWDFYKEEGYVNSQLEAGIRINYDWKNIIMTAGFNYDKIIELTPKYIYEKSDNESLMNLLNVSEISGVQVNGVDSAHYVFYTAQDEELITSLTENQSNRYHYVSIPLKIGYEFEASKFSIILQGGLSYNRLVGAKGNYLRKYESKENIDIYYNQGIELALLSRKNQMLKSSYFSFIASIAGNARLTSSLDLFGEFTYSKSQDLITKNDYFNGKKITNFGTNFGIKYYLQPRLNKNETVQQLF